tara:strand:+ start:22192 stop:23451 length:1260 start_codon:yes stop_codon:yes gene_type:complete
MDRRTFLLNGSVLGLSMGSLLKAQAESNLKIRAKSVIQIFLPGGMAHQESWIPIPDAPIEYRGPLGAVNTKVDGLRLSENLRETAKIADKITVIQSMTHGEAAHERGTHNMMTGYRPSPSLIYPSIGSVVAHELGGRNNIPPYVAIPNKANEFGGPGYLSTAFGPFGLGSNPESGNFQVRDLGLPSGVDTNRFAKRKSMLSVVDNHFSNLEKSDSLGGVDKFYSQAYDLISSKSAREAFDLKAENAKIRAQYGTGAAGSRFLLSRRLAEAGVRYITVTFGSWDMHDGVEAGIKRWQPEFDKAYAALIRDLDDRGMLDETLVVVTSEFGRTPKINRTAGRDHWPKLFGAALAGGGIKQGSVYGKPDMTASEPEENPVSPADLSATLYHLMGIDPEKTLLTPDQRPIGIVKDGKILSDIMG